MARDQDDDAAFGWDGDISDPTHVEAPAADPTPEDAALAPAVGSSAALVGYGILAGLYLLFVVGWIVASQRDSYSAGALVDAVLYQLGEFFAIVAPVLWFGLVLLLTRGRRASVRLGWLLVGLPLVAPWPYVLSVAGS